MRDAPAVVSGGRTTKGEEQTGRGTGEGRRRRNLAFAFFVCLEARLKERDDTVAMDDIMLDEWCGGSFIRPPTLSFS